MSLVGWVLVWGVWLCGFVSGGLWVGWAVILCFAVIDGVGIIRCWVGLG